MKLKLDTVLTVVLIAYFILHYGLAPRVTSYWLFAIIFAGLIIFGFLDTLKLKESIYEKFKNITLWLLIGVTIIGAFSSEIILRHESLPTFRVHDIVIQQEYAIKYLISGKNPYSSTYFGTPLEQWFYSGSEPNPALYHFVMEPFYLLFSLPFYVASGRILGFFDGRIPLLFLLFSILGFIQKHNLDGEKKRAFMVFLAFNPLTLPYALEGRSDFFMFAFLFAALYFLHKNKLYISSGLLALAFTVKQSAWPIFPLWVAYLWFRQKNREKVFKAVGVFFVVFATITLPFFLWNPKAFINSTILYLSGNTAHSYPINGYGFGMVLNQVGIIKNLHDKFPFIIFQFAFAFPLIVILVRALKKNLQVRTLIIFYSLLLFVFWYFSRYFNNNHIAYITTVITTAYFWPDSNANKKV